MSVCPTQVCPFGESREEALLASCLSGNSAGNSARLDRRVFLPALGAVSTAGAISNLGAVSTRASSSSFPEPPSAGATCIPQTPNAQLQTSPRTFKERLLSPRQVLSPGRETPQVMSPGSETGQVASRWESEAGPASPPDSKGVPRIHAEVGGGKGSNVHPEAGRSEFPARLDQAGLACLMRDSPVDVVRTPQS